MLSTLGTNLNFFTIYTLVDITATGVTRNNAGDDLQRNQQRNWETVLQVVGLRAQPIMIDGPVCLESELDAYEFGEMYTGRQKVWSVSIGVEHRDVYAGNNDALYGLTQDFAQVPVVCGLTETAKFMLPIFYPNGPIKNIYFKLGQTVLNI